MSKKALLSIALLSTLLFSLLLPALSHNKRLSASPAPELSYATVSARTLLGRLPVRPESRSSSYQRSYFKTWIDADKDGCNTREEVLIHESKVAVTKNRYCTISRGKWVSRYDNRTWTAPSDVDIDHMIPLKESWESGAYAWSSAKRQRLANDLGFSGTLSAMTDNLNSSKGDRDPAQWLPPANRCHYAKTWVQVKYRWGLSIDSKEKAALGRILSGTCGSSAITVPSRAS